VARSAFAFAGQKCSSNSRVYVDRHVLSQFLDALSERARAMRIGRPEHEATMVGPVIGEKSVARYEAAIHAVTEAGGTVVCGGNRLAEGELGRGCFVSPAVVIGLERDHRLLRDELFVPLTVVTPVDSLDEAIGLANETDYGLTAGLYSSDDKEISEFLDQMQAGVLYLNRPHGATTGARVGLQTFGGWKASGSTGKNAYGPYYLHNFIREQSRTFGGSSR
jgi:1-pyrroline-5-carboxylate dehydrogenase